MKRLPTKLWLDRHLLAALVSVALCTSCGSEVPLLRRQLDFIGQQLRTLNRHVNELEHETRDGFRIALCRPEIRQLLDDVQKECQTKAEAIALEAAQRPAAEMCETHQIHPAVVDMDPEHKGRFLKFMSLLRHESAYLRPDATDFSKLRRDRIERMALQPLLHNTVFLIVSHPVPNEPNKAVEAYKRAQLMAHKLAQFNGNIDESRIRIWVYAFPIARSEIDNPSDMPIAPEPNDLNRTVWVFRADC